MSFTKLNRHSKVKKIIGKSYDQLKNLSIDKLCLALEIDLISKKEFNLLMHLKSNTASYLTPKKLIKTFHTLCDKGFLSDRSCIIPD